MVRRRVRCGRCLRWFLIRLAVRQHFHACSPPPRPTRRVAMPSPRWPSAEEARRSVWVGAFTDALGDEVLLRPLDDDEVVV